MKRKNKKFQKKGASSLSKLSLFQKNDGKFKKKCPLSIKKWTDYRLQKCKPIKKIYV